MKQININLIKVLSVCLLLSLAVQCCAATTVSIADITADPGDVVTVPLMVNDMTDFGTGTINITYDSSVVHVTDVTDSSDSMIAAFNNNNTAGFTAISVLNTAGANGNIIFANVVFTAVGAGSTPLNIDGIVLYDRSSNPISAAVDNGLFTSGDVSTPPADSTPSSGKSTTGAASVSTPTPSVRDGANPASASESAPHNDEGADEETDTSGAISSTVEPTPNSKKTPGFEAISAVIGLVIISLILRCDNT